MPCAKAGPVLLPGLSQLPGVKAPALRVPCLRRKGPVPPPCRAMPLAAQDLHAHCSAIQHCSLWLPTGATGAVDTRALCQHPWARGSTTRPRFSPCHPHLPRAAVEKGGDGWCSRGPWHTMSLRCQMRVLVHKAPQTAVGHVPPSATQPCQPCCHHCAMNRADPGRLFGRSASPLRQGPSSLPSLPGHRAPAHGSVPAPPILPSLSSPFLPQVPSRTQDGRWPVVARVGQSHELPSAPPGLCCAC